jgi:flagellar basal-body rod protein FlgF
MDRAIYTSMTGASQTLSRQASVAHNLANVSTNGYRSEEHRLRAVEIQRKGEALKTALPTRAFVVDASTHTDFSSGPLMPTGRELDVAIKGKGWVALAMPDGTEAYTRSGSLEINLNGVLQTKSGISVAGDGGQITIPPEVKVTLGRDGTISVIPESGAQNVVNVVGRIKLVNPPEANLVRGGDGLFRMNDRSAAPVDDAVQMVGGYTEGSNVNPVEQMVSMISLSRQYEMQIKMLQSADTNDRAATQILSTR